MNISIIEQNDQRVLTTAQLAVSFGADVKIISNNFTRNKDRYKENKHYIQLSGDALKQFKAIHQIDESLKFVSTLYLWTEKGAWLHAKSLNTDAAWDAYEKLVDEYYKMVETVQPKSQLEIMQMAIGQMVEQERRLSQMETRTAAIEEKQDNIKEILSLNPTEWRKKVTSILNKIAQARGGYGEYQNVRNESYELLEDRAKCKLSIRVLNKQKVMSLNGISKSTVDKVSKLDAVADDARLTEIYLAIVKEMAVKNNVRVGA